MILFPPSKLNLGLQIIAKRSDAYHDLQTVFYQFPLKDVLEILIDESLSPGTCNFNSTGLPIPGGENLCEKAYYLLNKDYSLPGVKIHLHKIIPMGAGLGGGSSDAAYTLRLLNSLFNLQLSSNKLMEYALLLGSDCPLFINDNTQYAEGRGDLLEPIELSLKGKYLIIINPGIHISTKEAFSNIHPAGKKSCREVVSQTPKMWKDNLLNDFEKSVFPKHPILNDIKASLYDKGAEYASMSGSGSTIFGIFNENPDLQSFPNSYFVWETFL